MGTDMKYRNNRELLIFIHQRLVNVHGESKFYDYMHKLREVINDQPKEGAEMSRIMTAVSQNILDEIENDEN